MGQKVNPFAYRLGKIYNWQSRWFAKTGEYKKLLIEDVRLRRHLLERLKLAGIIKVEIERSINSIKIIVYVSRPGVVIGRGGSGLELLKKEIYQQLKIKQSQSKIMKVDLQVEEVKNPELASRFVAQRICDQLAKKYPHRRAVAMAMDRVMSSGALGVKIALSGRIAGAEISRREKYSRGSIPLQTLRADIDYCEMPAFTKSGYVGVKIWIYKKEKEIK